MKRYSLFLIILLLSNVAMSGPNYQRGKIKNLTAITDGILIMMDKGLPDNCEGTPYGWLLIKQEYTAITSVVLAAWASGKKEGTIYTSGRPSDKGFCIVIQFDPVN